MQQRNGKYTKFHSKGSSSEYTPNCKRRNKERSKEGCCGKKTCKTQQRKQFSFPHSKSCCDGNICVFAVYFLWGKEANTPAIDILDIVWKYMWNRNKRLESCVSILAREIYVQAVRRCEYPPRIFPRVEQTSIFPHASETEYNDPHSQPFGVSRRMYLLSPFRNFSTSEGKFLYTSQPNCVVCSILFFLSCMYYPISLFFPSHENNLLRDVFAYWKKVCCSFSNYFVFFV